MVVLAEGLLYLANDTLSRRSDRDDDSNDDCVVRNTSDSSCPFSIWYV